ncbi:MAG TPA: hypothetical protein VMR97_13680 [Acidimicrobiales bacterium]|nr:hypothetical protein [Acidimicrobiales bacterium]
MPDEPAITPRHGGIWTSRRALWAHVALGIWLPGCGIACWWQVQVALSGDSLGWVYSVMWPCFAVFGTVFWWFFVHDDPEKIGARGLRRLQRAAAVAEMAESRARSLERIRLAEEEDPELAAYNSYLAELARADRKGTAQ